MGRAFNEALLFKFVDKSPKKKKKDYTMKWLKLKEQKD